MSLRISMSALTRRYFGCYIPPVAVIERLGGTVPVIADPTGGVTKSQRQARKRRARCAYFEELRRLVGPWTTKLCERKVLNKGVPVVFSGSFDGLMTSCARSLGESHWTRRRRRAGVRAVPRVSSVDLTARACKSRCDERWAAYRRVLSGREFLLYMVKSIHTDLGILRTSSISLFSPFFHGCLVVGQLRDRQLIVLLLPRHGLFPSSCLNILVVF